MDFYDLSVIKDPAHPPIEVPYLCKEPYDGTDFHGYPQRNGYGWLLSGGLSKPANWRQLTADFLPFLQNWLYFGLLEAMLGIPLQIQDFLYASGGLVFVTIKALPRYLKASQNRLKRMAVEDLKLRALSAR